MTNFIIAQIDMDRGWNREYGWTSMHDATRYDELAAAQFTVRTEIQDYADIIEVMTDPDTGEEWLSAL